MMGMGSEKAKIYLLCQEARSMLKIAFRSDAFVQFLFKTPHKFKSFYSVLGIDYFSTADHRIRDNKAGYTATPVACGRAGVTLEMITRAFGQED